MRSEVLAEKKRSLEESIEEYDDLIRSTKKQKFRKPEASNFLRGKADDIYYGSGISDTQFTFTSEPATYVSAASFVK